MFQGHRIGAVVLMGGEGHRFGGKVPKQFVLLGGKRVYLHTLEKFLGLFDEIVLVCHREWVEEVQREVGEGARVVEGGSTRQESSYRGLRGFLEKPEVVAIHDGVRPFVSKEILRENVEMAIGWGAVDTCIPSADTLVYAPGGEVIEAIPQRGDFLRGQTPQTFRYEWILEAHEAARQRGIVDRSDDCRLVIEMGREVRIVRGSEENIKITSESDLQMAEVLLEKWTSFKRF